MKSIVVLLPAFLLLSFTTPLVQKDNPENCSIKKNARLNVSIQFVADGDDVGFVNTTYDSNGLTLTSLQITNDLNAIAAKVPPGIVISAKDATTNQDINLGLLSTWAQNNVSSGDLLIVTITLAI